MNLSSFFKFLIPTCCILCNKRQEESICFDCIKELTQIKTPRCTICANPSHQWVCKNCKRNKPIFDATYCVGDIQSRLQIPLQRLRKNNLHMQNGIIQVWKLLGARNCAPVDLLIPAPICTTKLKARGFNQAWELTKSIAVYKKINANRNLLRKLTSTEKTPDAKIMRTDFLKKSFYIDQQELDKIGGLINKRIGVVDDFMNTGATLSAIASLLKENGASWVSNWIILRTPSPELF